MELGKWRKLKIKVGGRTVKVRHGEQDEDVQFLEKLDEEFSLLNDVFKCLSTVDKSLYPDWEKNITIFFQLSSQRIGLSMTFCQKVINAMEAELTEKMQLKTRIDTGGFVDFDQ